MQRGSRQPGRVIPELPLSASRAPAAGIVRLARARLGSAARDAEQAGGALAVGLAGRQRGGPVPGDWRPSAGLLPAWEACREASGVWEGRALVGRCSGGVPSLPRALLKQLGFLRLPW